MQLMHLVAILSYSYSLQTSMSVRRVDSVRISVPTLMALSYAPAPRVSHLTTTTGPAPVWEEYVAIKMFYVVSLYWISAFRFN